MKTLRIIGVVVLAMVIIVAIVIVMQPKEPHIEKSIVINAPATSIFPEVSNHKNFNIWSPWTKMDPAANQPFEGAKANVTSKLAWDASKTGIRSQRIEEIEENKRVRCAMTFNGYDGKFYSEFKLTPDVDGTRVTWTYDGQNVGLKGKAIWVFAGSVLSSQYEQGLRDLKYLVEDKIDH